MVPWNNPTLWMNFSDKFRSKAQVMLTMQNSSTAYMETPLYTDL